MNFYIKKLLLLFFLVSTISYSQNRTKPDSVKIYKLSDVVVSASKTRQSELETASSVTVIDSNDINEKGNVSVFDLLKDVYGLSLSSQGAPGSLAYVSIRGGNTGHTLVLG